MTKWQVQIVRIVVFADEIEAAGEGIAECLAPWDAIGSGKAGVDEIEGGEQEQWLVRPLVRTPLLHRRDVDIEVVKAFDGGCEEYEVRKARILIGGKRKNRLLAAARVGDDRIGDDRVVAVHGGEEVFPVDPCGVAAGGDAEVVGLSWKLSGELRVGFQIQGQGQEQETFGLVIHGGEEVAKDRWLGGAFQTELAGHFLRG